MNIDKLRLAEMIARTARNYRCWGGDLSNLLTRRLTKYADMLSARARENDDFT